MPLGYGECAECGTELDEHVHIYIMSKKLKWNLRNNRGDLEEVVCSKCRYDIEWSEGWEDDEDV